MAVGLPKVLLFDIGGVCVVSPMSAILSYEIDNGISQGYINFAISASAPNGAWNQLERGEIPMDSSFFDAFGRDLRHEGRWLAFQKSLKSRYEESRKMHEKPSRDDSGDSLSGIEGTEKGDSEQIPPLPAIDCEELFWDMMRVSRQPDPFMFPAIQKLKASGKFVIAALSNTVIFPPGHPFGTPPKDAETDVRAMFDVFVSSAHVGLRKPERPIYELAAKLAEEEWRNRGGKGSFETSDVVFLDDIGTNCKMGRSVGFKTIKVGLGRTQDAVRELESITGVQLMDSEQSSQAKL